MTPSGFTAIKVCSEDIVLNVVCCCCLGLNRDGNWNDWIGDRRVRRMRVKVRRGKSLGILKFVDARG